MLQCTGGRSQRFHGMQGSRQSCWSHKPSAFRRSHAPCCWCSLVSPLPDTGCSEHHGRRAAPDMRQALVSANWSLLWLTTARLDMPFPLVFQYCSLCRSLHYQVSCLDWKQTNSIGLPPKMDVLFPAYIEDKNGIPLLTLWSLYIMEQTLGW